MIRVQERMLSDEAGKGITKILNPVDALSEPSCTRINADDFLRESELMTQIIKLDNQENESVLNGTFSSELDLDKGGEDRKSEVNRIDCISFVQGQSLPSFKELTSKDCSTCRMTFSLGKVTGSQNVRDCSTKAITLTAPSIESQRRYLFGPSLYPGYPVHHHPIEFQRPSPDVFVLGNKPSSCTRVLVRRCANCNTHKTPSWRRCGPEQTVLCNACGLYYNEHKSHRPFRVGIDGRTRVLRIQKKISNPPDNKCDECGTIRSRSWRRATDPNEIQCLSCKSNLLNASH